MTMRRLLSVLGFWVALAGLAHAAIGWQVVLPQTCTGASAPALCCLSGNSADNSTACNVSTTFGHFKVVMATFNPLGVCAGGVRSGEPCTVNGDCPASTCTANGYTNSGTYSTSGDALTANQFKRLGMDSIVGTSCDASATKGYLPILVGRRSLRIHLIKPNTAVEETAGIAVAAGASANVPGDQFDCLIIGY